MKFAFITTRYGGEIAAGADHICRLLAEEVVKRHDIDVLTTTARDSRTWGNGYAEGADRVRGVLVRRFAVNSSYDPLEADAVSRRLRDGPRYRTDELAWVRQAGPASANLLDYLRRQHGSYDALVFFGLWHPLTVEGLTIAPERSVLFPHIWHRPELRFDLWAEVLSTPRALAYTSNAERRLVHEYVGLRPKAEDLVGIGVHAPPSQSYPRYQQDPADVITPDEESQVDGDVTEENYLAGRGVLFKRRQRLYGGFALYGGRIAADNGCEEMLEYFDSATSVINDLTLVLMGVKLFKVPETPHLRLAGMLPASDRMAAFEAASVTIAPVPDDLAAQSVLESFAVGTPVLASAMNQAAVEHCREARAGLFYANRGEFVESLRTLTATPLLLEQMGDNGRQYVRQNYQWDAVVGRFERLVSNVRGRG